MRVAEKQALTTPPLTITNRDPVRSGYWWQRIISLQNELSESEKEINKLKELSAPELPGLLADMAPVFADYLADSMEKKTGFRIGEDYFRSSIERILIRIFTNLITRLKTSKKPNKLLADLVVGGVKLLSSEKLDANSPLNDFAALSTKILKNCFPNGEQDLPFMYGVRQLLWAQLEKLLPLLLQEKYKRYAKNTNGLQGKFESTAATLLASFFRAIKPTHKIAENLIGCYAPGSLSNNRKKAWFTGQIQGLMDDRRAEVQLFWKFIFSHFLDTLKA